MRRMNGVGLRSILFGSHRLRHAFSEIHVGRAMNRGPHCYGAHLNEIIFCLSFLKVTKSLL